MRIAIFGASGYVGSRLATRLADSGHQLVLVSRDPRALIDRFPEAESCQADVLVPATLDACLDGVDVVYYLVHAMALREEGFAERDLLGARNVADAAARRRVGRIIYLGGLGVPSRRLSKHLASRQAVGAALATTGIPVTEFRSAIIIGSGSASFEILRYLTERLPLMITPRWVATKCQPISVRDVLGYLVEALDRPQVTGIVEIGGPDVLSYGEMMQTYARLRGLPRRMIPVPFLTPRLSSYWLGLVSPVPTSIARPLVEGLRNEVVVHDPGPASSFTIRPMPFEAAVERALDRMARNEVESTWFDAFTASRQGRATAVFESSEGMLTDRRARDIPAPPDIVFAEAERLGGAHGWPFADPLWRIRGVMDRLVGGVGMRLGRRDPERLRVGDALDFWRVEAIRRPELLRLRAEMRTPGPAWLQYEVEPTATGSRLVQTAFFEPHGLAGLIYWYSLLPIHDIIFRGMVAALAKQAVERAQQQRAASGENAG